MIELLIYPIITGIVASIFSVIFEYYIVIPNKENQEENTRTFNFSFSLKFILAQFAGVIIFELIIRTFFPKFNIPTELLGGILKDSNITFAAIFYVCFTTILLTIESKNNVLFFIGVHLIPYICVAWWIFTFTHIFKIYDSFFTLNPSNFAHSTETLLPVFHNVMLCWIFYGLRVFLSKIDGLAFIAIIIFPLNALFLLNYTSALSSWGGALITAIGMVLIVREENLSLKKNEKVQKTTKPMYSAKRL